MTLPAYTAYVDDAYRFTLDVTGLEGAPTSRSDQRVLFVPASLSFHTVGMGTMRNATPCDAYDVERLATRISDRMDLFHKHKKSFRLAACEAVQMALFNRQWQPPAADYVATAPAAKPVAKVAGKSKAKVQATVVPAPAPVVDGKRRSKQQIVIDLLMRGTPVTTDEIAHATGWQIGTVRGKLGLVKRLGYDLQKLPHGRYQIAVA